jgi:hypothetical protein
MYKSKKGMSMEFIIILILSIVTLIILTFYLYDSINDGRYISSIVGCQTFFKQIEGKRAFFDNSLNHPNQKLYDTIAKLCPSRTIDIKKGEIRKVTNLIQDCWEKTGSGVDFYGATTKGVGICLYCGSIEVQDEISNFNELVSKDLEKLEDKTLFDQSVEVVNLNKESLKLIPQSVSNKQNVHVFYYSYRPEFPPIDESTGFFEITENYIDTEILDPLSEFIGGFGSIASLGIFAVTDSSVETYAGIVLDKEFDNSRKDVDEIKSVIATRGCNVIIPEKNLDY